MNVGQWTGIGNAQSTTNVNNALSCLQYYLEAVRGTQSKWVYSVSQWVYSISSEWHSHSNKCTQYAVSDTQLMSVLSE